MLPVFGARSGWGWREADGLLQPVSINLAGGSSVASFSLYYCPSNGASCSTNNGNVLSQVIQPLNVTDTYTYDTLNRIASGTDGSTWSQNYVYDNFGNRAVWGTAGAYIPNPNFTPQVPSLNSPLPYTNNQWNGATYDTAGNLQAVNSFTYTYDAENRQTQTVQVVGSNNITSTYNYDGEGRRVMRVAGGATTVYAYDAQGQLAAEYTVGTMPASPCQTCYLTADHLGSTRVVTDGSGNVVARNDYVPFGEELFTSNRTTALGYTTDTVAQKFTGKERDVETGLDFFGARYSSAAQGRFSSPDTESKGIVPSYPQTWNKYVYAVNNPLAYKDVNGQWPFYVHEEMLDLAFGRVLPGTELKQLKNVNWAMDFAQGQQSPGGSNEHSMCVPGQGVSGCLEGIQNFLSLELQLAQSLPRGPALSFVGEAIHTIADWSSPTHVNDAGIPYTWNDPPQLSAESRAHFMGEATMYANPGRYYLGVRLMGAIYLTRFPEEQEKFKNLDSWILQDARQRAFSLAVQQSLGSGGFLSRSVEADKAAERMAQCWAGNPAACN